MTSFLLIPFLLRQADMADITYKPVEGAVHTYQSHSVSTMDRQGQQGTVEVYVVFKTTTGPTSGGVTDVTRETKDIQVTYNGTEINVGDAPKGATTGHVNNVGYPVLDAETVKKMDINVRSFFVTLITRPDHPIELNKPFDMEYKGDNDLGTVDAKARTTVTGSETVDGIDCWKVQEVYAEQIQDAPMSSVGDVWLSKADHDLIKASFEIENYTANAMMPPSHTHTDIKQVPNQNALR